MYGYVYKTTNIINGKMYIGQHKSEKFDESYKGSGVILTKALEKYGKSNFKTQIIECCETAEELDNREVYWIAQYNASESETFYNVASGCNGSHEYSTSELTRQRLSEAQTGKRVINKNGRVTYVDSDLLDKYLAEGWSLGYNYTEEQMKERTAKFKQTHYSSDTTEWRRKISDSLKSKRWVNDGINDCCIHASELNDYLNQGYSRGRCTNTWNREKMCLYTSDGHRKYVKKEEVDIYLSRGYSKINPKV